MADDSVQTKGEIESRRVAEASRQQEWTDPSFLRELFLGNFRFELIDPFPKAHAERPAFATFFSNFKALLAQEADPVAIDATGEYPPRLVDGLRRIGAFGLKIPTEYGGLGCSQQEYNELMEYLGSIDGNVTALLSAHQSIGVPQPIKLFGTAEQKERFLPRCAAGAISAFALTEATVGSDPARLATTAVESEDGESFVINGEKLWCTNGTMAELLVVMARDPKSSKISTFVVESSWPGVTVEYRCRFMGLRALANAVISFRDVRVPRENLIGKIGQGLKIALITLNTGRLALPATCLGAAKLCIEMSRRWGSVREQWGLPIGRHESIAHKIGDIASTTFAMEAVSQLASRLADRGGYDIRLEAAAAKEWNTTRAWDIIDAALQIRGGRGYETEQSLADRGDAPLPIERMMRDLRINTLFEGSSEVMHLFIARESVDTHLQVAGVIIDRDKSLEDKLKALPKIAWFYARWYSKQWFGWSRWPRFAEYGRHAGHLGFIERRTRKLAREVFHAMVIYGPKMERKQGFLFRVVDIGLELFTMSTTIAYTRAMRRDNHPSAASAEEMTELFCRDASRRIDGWFRALWRNDDDLKTSTARAVLEGKHAGLEAGIRPLGISDDDIRPKDVVTEAANKPEPAGVS